MTQEFLVLDNEQIVLDSITITVRLEDPTTIYIKDQGLSSSQVWSLALISLGFIFIAVVRWIRR